MMPGMRMPWSKSGNLQLDLLDAPTVPEAASAPPVAPGASARTASMVPTASLFEDANNPRTEIPDAELDELAEDIRQRGILQPIVVRAAYAAGRQQSFAQTTETLLKALSEQGTCDRAFVDGYITAIDQEHLHTTNVLSGCVFFGVTTTQLGAVVKKYIEDHPQRWNNPPNAVTQDALEQAFPCQGKRSRTRQFDDFVARDKTFREQAKEIERLKEDPAKRKPTRQ